MSALGMVETRGLAAAAVEALDGAPVNSGSIVVSAPSGVDSQANRRVESNSASRRNLV
jgi:hypothetical protein